MNQTQALWLVGSLNCAELSDIDKVAERVSSVCTQAMGSHPGPELFLYDPTPEGCERWTHPDIQLGYAALWEHHN